MNRLRKAAYCLLAFAVILSGYMFPIHAQGELENVALNKATNASAGRSLAAVDGNIATYWDGGVYPSELFVDLGGYYDISKIKVIPYYGGSRYYHYEVYSSVDGAVYEKLGEKSTDETQTSAGETYTFDTKVARYVKVKMTYNSANTSVHINELEVYGVENTTYEKPDTPTIDPNDPGNIAFGKPTRSTTNNNFTQLVVDGSLETAWSGEDYPKFVDVDLKDNYDISKITVAMPATSQFAYTVYGSIDGVHFETIVASPLKESAKQGDTYTFDTPVTYRVVRVNVTANSRGEGAGSMVSEIKVYGEKSAVEKVETRKELGLTSYDEWLKENYQVDVEALKDETGNYRMEDTFTDQDVYNEVYNLISRMLGDKYKDWFTLELAKSTNGKDFYELSMQDGKVHLKGNEGLSLTTGLNYYLKYYCNVHISQQTKQVTMPENMPIVNENVFKESPYEVRYAYNYCTLSYTMPFWGYDEWQREMDYFALNGVNLILDTTATEALWIEYLMNYGYDIEEAKAFVCGYSYKAWWLMGNLESYGGPVSDEWVKDTVQMARVNQRRMSVLGMKPCLQGFMGAMPEHFADVANDTLMNEYGYEDIHSYMVAQGDWSGFTRPPILKTTYNGYDDLARKFYDTQEFIYGQVTNYYAGDLAHEGGVIPPDLSKPQMSAHILEQMMSYDKDAVWIIQSWLSNPDPEILQGFGENKEDHVLVLDLDATENPHWSNTTNWNGKEFGGTSWVFCMLDNYGGRTGMHGELEYLATQITKANEQSSHMKGIGITPEGTLLNPVNYDLFWEMGWETKAKDTEAWLKEYITRRYGAYSDNAWKGWQILLSTAYGANNDDGSAKYHTGNVNCITNMRPSFNPEIVIGDYKLTYDATKFEKAMDYILMDFDKFKENECYVYDVVDILRQTIANSQVEFFYRVNEAYSAGNIELFTKYKDKLLNSILLLDEISAYQKDSLYGTWISKATNFYNDERNSGTYDDYSKDMMVINAKAIVNIWSSKTLQTYAHRQYNGMEKDYNYPMWKLWLDRVETAMQTGVYSAPSSNKDYFNIGWNVVINGKDYSTEVKNAAGSNDYRSLYDIYNEIHENYLTRQAQKDKIMDENIAGEGKAYAQTTLGSYGAKNINDGNTGSLWIASSSVVPVYAGIEFDQEKSIYGMQVNFEPRPQPGANVMNYYVQAAKDGGYETIYTGKSFNEVTGTYTTDITFEEPVNTKDVRITITSNGGIYPALAEVKLYSSKGIQLIEGSYMSIENGILKNIEENATVAKVAEYLYHGSGELVFKDGDKVLTSDDLITENTVIALLKDGKIIDQLSVSFMVNCKDDLVQLINDVKELPAKNYSKLSYDKVLKTAKEAQSILDDELSVGIDYAEVMIKLQEAIDGLVDVTILRKQVEELANKPADAYIKEYYQKYEAYYTQAKEVYDRLDVATKDEIYGAMGNAELAANYLMHENSSNVALKATAYADNELGSYYGKIKINNGNFEDCWVANSLSNFPVSGGITLDKAYAVDFIKVAFEENGYRNTRLGFEIKVQNEAGDWQTIYTGSTGSKNGYTFKVDLDGKVIRDVKVTITSYATDAGSPYPGVSEIEVYEKTDLTPVKKALEAYANVNLDGYTPATLEAVAKAAKKAQFVVELETYTQVAIDQTAKDLTDAIANLERIANKDALEIAVALANEISDEDLANVVPVVVEEFKAALQEATELLADLNATQVQVDVSFERLANAMHKLSFVTGDKTALIALVTRIEALDNAKYIESTWDAMLPALNNAIAVIANENALKDEIDEAYDALIRAFLELRLKPSKDLLNDLITKAESLNKPALANAIASAKAVYDNPEATQVEVDNALKALDDAINSLVKSNPKAPSVLTGDSVNIIAPMAGLVLVTAALYETKKRRYFK